MEEAGDSEGIRWGFCGVICMGRLGQNDPWSEDLTQTAQ